MFAELTKLYMMLMEMSKTNPVIAGVVSLWGLGVVTYLVKGIPTRIWNFLVRQSTTSLTVNSADPIYYELLNWLSAEKMHGFVRTLTFTKSSKHAWSSADSTMALGYGRQWFMHKGRIMAMVRHEVEANQTSEAKEQMVITTLGRSHSAFEDLFESVNEKDAIDPRMRIYNWEKGWQLLCKQYKRKLTTVAIPEQSRLKLITHIDRFLAEKDWYLENGIPWRTGIMLSGPPGTGKTSLLKAVCSHYDRPLYLISLSDMNDDSLRNALSSVPEGSVIAIEDIDADAVTRTRGAKFNPDGSLAPETEDSVFLTLSGILNAIDGAASGEGRILIATTNHLEVLDPALVRPGRFDLKLEIGHMNHESFHEYIGRFFPTFQDLKFWTVRDGVAPCEVQKAVFENRDNPGLVVSQVGRWVGNQEKVA